MYKKTYGAMKYGYARAKYRNYTRSHTYKRLRGGRRAFSPGAAYRKAAYVKPSYSTPKYKRGGGFFQAVSNVVNYVKDRPIRQMAAHNREVERRSAAADVARLRADERAKKAYYDKHKAEISEYRKAKGVSFIKRIFS